MSNTSANEFGLRAQGVSGLVLLGAVLASVAGCADSSPKEPTDGGQPAAQSQQAPTQPDPAAGDGDAVAAAPHVHPRTVKKPVVDPSQDLTAEHDDPGSPKTEPTVDGETQTAESAPPAADTEKPRPRTASEIIESVDDGVVLVTTLDALGRETGAGSGFVIDERGLIATNYHVVANAVSAFVQFRDGRKADVVGVRAFEPEDDLAILQIDAPAEKLEPFELRKPDELHQADQLIAIGHPSGFQFTVTTGIVSAVRKTSELPQEYQQFLASAEDTVWVQTSAAISAGSSGGPLLNNRGEVVAVNTWIAEGQNLGFAVHVRHLLELSEQLNAEPVPLPIPGLGLITTPDVAAVLEEFNREFQHYASENQRQPSQQAALAAAVRNNPRPTYARRLLELAQQAENETTAVEAIYTACLIATDQSAGSMGTVDEAVRLTSQSHLQSPRLYDVALSLSATGRQPVFDLLREIIDQSPHRDVRAVACYSLAGAFAAADTAMQGLYDPDRLALLQRVADEFADVQIRGQRLGAAVETDLFALKHLALGRRAPNIVGSGVDDQPFELKDYRGKVTVVDFIADWCPHCRNLYPHERTMVERFKEQPFALLGVSTDERATLERLVAQKVFTWRNWHDGPQGKIAEQWQVAGFPTIYVLDADGRVRHRMSAGGVEEELEWVVENLLAENSLTLPGDVISAGETWKYLDDGSDQRAAWRDGEFDDSGWTSGTAPFGFGWDDEATRLSDNRATTVYFRRKFTVEAEFQPADLVLEVWGDDGIAVYINGTEVARIALPADAAFDATAGQPSLRHGREAAYFFVKPSLLVEGDNQIAVEVHQEHPASADLRFDLALSSNVIEGLRAALLETDSHAHGRALAILRQLGPDARAADADVRKLLESAGGFRQIYALYTHLALNPKAASDLKLPQATTLDEQQRRTNIALFVSSQVWQTALNDRLSLQDYQSAWQRLLAAKVLMPQLPNYHVINGLCELRLGRPQDAALSLRGNAVIKFNWNALELACLSMCHSQLGAHEQARTTQQNLEKELGKPQWAWNTDARRLARQAEQMLAQAVDSPATAPRP